MPRLETIERHMFGHRESNTHGVHPTVFGDGDGKPGIVGMMREVRWYLRLVVAGIGVVLAVIIGKWAEMKVMPAQSVSQSVITSDDAALKPGAYTTAQLAAKLQLSAREVQDRAAKGEIPGAWKDGKAWRFDQPSVDSWLAASAANAVTAANAANADQN